MGNYWLSRRTAKPCSYVALSSDEIGKLKRNDYDPHKVKGYDSKKDLFKCKPSGIVKIGYKSKHQDPDSGEWKRPGEDEEYEDTGININDLPWDGSTDEDKMEKPVEEVIIEFRVTGLDSQKCDEIKSLGIAGCDTWKSGDVSVPNTSLKHKLNGCRFVAGDEDLAFDARVEALMKTVNRVQELKSLGGKCQLFCAMYFAVDERPAITFPSVVLQQLSELHASIDVDIYNIGSIDAAQN